ncbi:MAG: AglZ/HisF2 family acetamidino modification protein [Chitinophagaceae bacterium]
MLSKRVIPVLLLRGNGLYKTVQFKNPVYIGDPINAVKLFNDKEVDELCFLDIEASKNKKEPNYELLGKIIDEAFMPFGYGGNITSVEQVRKLLKMGIEKVVINTAAFENPKLIPELFERFGASTIVAGVDVKKNVFGKYELYSHDGSKSQKGNVYEYCEQLEKAGAGELLVNSIDCDGKMNGYDVSLVKEISMRVGIPVIACGGAGKLDDIKECSEKTNAAAFAAGSMFVYHGPHKAVLINYPTQKELKGLLS